MRRRRILGLVAVVIGLLSACSPSSTSVPAASSSNASSATTSTIPTSPSTTDPAAGQPLIDHVTWTTTSQGRELRIYPTPVGRTDKSSDAVGRAWAEVLAAAPDANSPGMFDQFQCHWVFARAVEPDKPTWNLEPWRPDVGYDATVAAACNPGGPES